MLKLKRRNRTSETGEIREPRRRRAKKEKPVREPRYPEMPTWEARREWAASLPMLLTFAGRLGNPAAGLFQRRQMGLMWEVYSEVYQITTYGQWTRAVLLTLAGLIIGLVLGLWWGSGDEYEWHWSYNIIIMAAFSFTGLGVSALLALRSRWRDLMAEALVVEYGDPEDRGAITAVGSMPVFRLVKAGTTGYFLGSSEISGDRHGYLLFVSDGTVPIAEMTPEDVLALPSMTIDELKHKRGERWHGAAARELETLALRALEWGELRYKISRTKWDRLADIGLTAITIVLIVVIFLQVQSGFDINVTEAVQDAERLVP